MYLFYIHLKPFIYDVLYESYVVRDNKKKLKFYSISCVNHTTKCKYRYYYDAMSREREDKLCVQQYRCK